VESSDDAILSKTLQGIITTWNQGAQRMYGYTAEEAIGKSVTILIPFERLDEEPAIIERLKRGERIEHYETVRKRKDGTLLNVSLTVSPIKDATGKIIGASKIARDITERKRWEAEIKKAKDELELRVQERTASLNETTQQLETFCYTIAHDLRSPLRAQQSFASVLLEDYGNVLGETGSEYAERIIHSAKRLDQLVHDLLTYSRMSRSEIKFAKVDPAKVVKEVLETLAERIQSSGATISVGELMPVLAHEPTLNIVISNLVENALKFTAPGVAPQIQIRTILNKECVQLWVEDNGIGINPEHMPKIFGVFQRLHPNNVYPGTGIGLALVQKGVERMDGSVGVESEPGKGSRFWIQLPRAG
jgi:PAS domain S-box-containing protein